MEFRAFKTSESLVIERLFSLVFSKSEGEQEGELIGSLVKEMIASTDPRDLYGFVADNGDQILGAIFFSRLSFETNIDVFILAPVAVHSDHQGMGIGQALIAYGLQKMQKKGVSYITTYGDLSFYSRVGFQPISRDDIAPPHELSQPEGWLGQSLIDDAIEKIPGKSRCVKALDNPAYW
jgi:predicted N-acetyltransferase YhbS